MASKHTTYEQDQEDAQAFRRLLHQLENTIPIEKQMEWALSRVKAHLNKYPSNDPRVVSMFETLSGVLPLRSITKSLQLDQSCVLLDMFKASQDGGSPNPLRLKGVQLLEDLNRRERMWILFPLCCNLVSISEIEARQQGLSTSRIYAAKCATRKRILKELAALTN